MHTGIHSDGCLYARLVHLCLVPSMLSRRPLLLAKPRLRRQRRRLLLACLDLGFHLSAPCLVQLGLELLRQRMRERTRIGTCSYAIY